MLFLRSCEIVTMRGRPLGRDLLVAGDEDVVGRDEDAVLSELLDEAIQPFGLLGGRGRGDRLTVSIEGVPVLAVDLVLAGAVIDVEAVDQVDLVRSFPAEGAFVFVSEAGRDCDFQPELLADVGELLGETLMEVTSKGCLAGNSLSQNLDANAGQGRELLEGLHRHAPFRGFFRSSLHNPNRELR
jgi:hypothetical protein